MPPLAFNMLSAAQIYTRKSDIFKHSPRKNDGGVPLRSERVNEGGREGGTEGRSSCNRVVASLVVIGLDIPCPSFPLFLSLPISLYQELSY